MPVNASARMDAGPASPESAAGRVKMPEPTMFPITSAVAIQRPIDRFRRGFLISASRRLSDGVMVAISSSFLSTPRRRD
jgi:hypothetical protein